MRPSSITNKIMMKAKFTLLHVPNKIINSQNQLKVVIKTDSQANFDINNNIAFVLLLTSGSSLYYYCLIIYSFILI